MSDTGDTPTSGTEAPDPFLMGIADSDETVAKWDAAIEAAFPGSTGIQGEQKPEDEDEDEEEVDDQTQVTAPPSGDSQEGGEKTGTPGATGEETDLVAFLTEKLGTTPTQADIEGLIELSQWAATLTPEQAQAINKAYTDPTSVLTPVPVTPTEPSKWEKLAEEHKEDEVLGPVYAQLHANELEIAALRETTTQTFAQTQQQTIETQLVAGGEKFKTERGLTDQELEALTGAVASSRTFPVFMQMHNNDPAAAMVAALDHTYWASPQFRQAAIAREVMAQQEKEKTQHKDRKRRATSVSTSTGGNGASRTAAPSPKTHDDRWEAVKTELTSAMNNGNPEN